MNTCINNDTCAVYFPTISELKQIRKTQQTLLTLGYARNTQKYIHADVIQLCLKYNSCQPQIHDTVQWKQGETSKIFCIAMGESGATKQLYFGTKNQQNVCVFKTIQDVSNILGNLYTSTPELKLEIGCAVTVDTSADHYHKARIKYIGKVGAINELIGVDFDTYEPLNGHNGKGYFHCSQNNTGLFEHRSNIALTKEEVIKRLPILVQGCHSNNTRQQLRSTNIIRKLLSAERDVPIQAVMDSGVLPRMIQFLQLNDNPSLQFEAAWVITNLSNGDQVTEKIIENGAVPLLVKLLSSASVRVREQTIWALGNIAGENIECRNTVLDHGALQNLLPLFVDLNIDESKPLTLIRTATWTLSNLFRGEPGPKKRFVELGMQALSTLITSDDMEILQDTCWALSYITEQSGNIEVIIKSGIGSVLVNALDHSSAYVCHPALRSLGNIVTGCDEHTQYVINCGILPKLYHLLGSDEAPIRREACWVTANITAGSHQQIEAVIRAKIIPELVHILKTERIEVSKHALWALENLTSGGSDKQIQYSVNQEMIEVLCRFLNLSVTRIKKVLCAALDSIENILQVGSRIGLNSDGINPYVQLVEETGGFGHLEDIQKSGNVDDEICEKAAHITKTYFDDNLNREQQK